MYEHKNPSFLVDDEKDVTENNASLPSLQLDRHGLPLVPQPSRFRDDPLNWPLWMKWAVLIQIAIFAFLGPFNSAVVNPSLVLLAASLNVDSTVASYNNTCSIIAGGLSPFIFTPLTNIYGRRPVTLFAMLLTIAGGIGSGASTTYAGVAITRVLCGAGFGGMMSVGTSCINDMFFLHERGEKTGIYVIFVTNGSHIAALVGGFMGVAKGWQWDFYLGAIITSTSFVVALFLFPETLFPRDEEFLANRNRERSYIEMLWDFKGNMVPGRNLRLSHFTHSFIMLKYPSVTLPFIYYTCANFANTLPAVTLATSYHRFYDMDAAAIGICLGVSLTIGSVLGELCAGRLSDYIMYRAAARHDGIRKPEYRLYLSPLSAIFMPGGLIMFGATVGRTGFIPPLVGLSIAVFGQQIGSTCLYAYISDCYKPQTPETGVLFNLARGLSFFIPFVATPLANRISYLWAYFTFAAVIFAGYLPIAALIWRGERWRIMAGAPTFRR
ncbi:major facilitator superfamily domain-containing protein [Rhodocollybia butyracea]|uniref:Major facilitator superfamily domain-containing protein n=1 Tax=Rhodocollybia butyracea TaxID=206335 RepID=A0A9P5PEE7_9AGAR|nr:major facilitator superfamily domain-containing protein [Rhodocollybia butyracea]